jgi:hypothetical protein
MDRFHRAHSCYQRHSHQVRPTRARIWPGIASQVVEDKTRQTIRAAADRFVERAVNKRSLVGAEVYRRSFDLFLESTDASYIDEITVDHLLAFHGHLRKRGNSERTVANRHNHMKSLLLWCGVDKKNIGQAPKYEKKLPNPRWSAVLGYCKSGTGRYADC